MIFGWLFFFFDCFTDTLFQLKVSQRCMVALNCWLTLQDYWLFNCLLVIRIIRKVVTVVFVSFKFTCKQLERSSKKCEKEEKAQQAKVKKVSSAYVLG